MEHTKFCQSCGMPLASHEAYGTLGSGEKSGDYCAHCYQDGAFTWDCTMDEMIEFCLRFELQRTPSLDKAAARARMRQQFLTLKRWRARPGTERGAALWKSFMRFALHRKTCPHWPPLWQGHAPSGGMKRAPQASFQAQSSPSAP